MDVGWKEKGWKDGSTIVGQGFYILFLVYSRLYLRRVWLCMYILRYVLLAYGDCTWRQSRDFLAGWRDVEGGGRPLLTWNLVHLFLLCSSQ
jgi:hypothetical protein